jgi:signal transduction histidine kinase
VADNGKGINAAARPHIFEAFFTTKDAVGTGLGLWVSRQIIEKHGGSIRLRSSTRGPNRGTSFAVVLPSQTAGAAAGAAAAQAAGS